MPYRGAAPALQDTMAGRHAFQLDTYPSSKGFIDSGKLRLLAVTGATRAASLPNVPTVAESGVPGYDRTTWFGVAAPAVARSTVVAGFSSGELNAYRYENGRTLWADSLSRTSASTSVSALADIDADPVIDGGRAYAVGQGGRMVALELVSGQRLWEQNLAGIATPWVAGEWIFVITDDARLICLARASGKIRWISQLRRYRVDKKDKQKDPIAWVGPVLAGGRLWLVNSQGELVAASPADGTVATTISTKGRYALAPVVANAMLYTLSETGTITAYR